MPTLIEIYFVGFACFLVLFGWHCSRDPEAWLPRARRDAGHRLSALHAIFACVLMAAAWPWIVIVLIVAVALELLSLVRWVARRLSLRWRMRRLRKQLVKLGMDPVVTKDVLGRILKAI